MNLKQVRVQNYKCIEDSEWVDFERVTSLVGKNESGKTAFLQALEKLNPVNSTGQYDPLEEYPRRRYTHYKERHDEDPDPVASARYELSGPEIEEVEAQYGNGVLNRNELQLTKNYKNHFLWEIDLDESVVVANLIDRYDLHNKTKQSLRQAENLNELAELIDESDSDSNEFPQLKQKVNEIQEDGLATTICEDVLYSYLPQFLYFDEYSIMDGDMWVDQLRSRDNNNNLTEADETFLSLLSIANLDLDDFRQMEDYEEIIAELEAASNHITEQVFEYWTQGPNLRVEFDKSEEVPPPNNQQNQNRNKKPVLHVRIHNQRHQVTLPFNDRSMGFIWFFSFLAYFSDMENDNRELVLLLDEPGLNLHAKAQHDFLRFINDRLAPHHPVAYTTHSPFMLEPKRLERARLVLDDPEDEDEGTKISDDILRSDDDTIFPLQAVLGYDLIQTLLIGPECLLVEGKSDMIYLQVMSDILDRKDRTPLSHRWTIVPVSGADNVPTFVSLFGASDLDIAVLLDDDSRIQQRLEEIQNRHVLDMENVKLVSEYIEEGEGDTEDLFNKEFYVDLVTDAYGFELRGRKEVPNQLSLDDIQNKHPRITRRLESYFEEWEINEGTFRHHEPASHLQKNRDHFENQIDEETLERFESLFEDMNSIIENRA